MTTERKLEIHYAEDRIRAEVAEEIARAIEDAIPSTRHFWDTADAARAYALNDAAKLARKHAAAPAQIVAPGSVVSTEGSGQGPNACASCGATNWPAGTPWPDSYQRLVLGEPTEGSGQRCPSRESGGRHGCDLPAGHDGMHEVRVTRFFANDPAPGPWTGPRPTLSPPDTEGEPNA